MECPAVRDPVIKLGHSDPRFDGEPAVGRVMNLEVVDEYSLRGDLDGLPNWLGQVLASAYPSRSIEATWNYRCSVGHTHDFVITGLALLGVQEPAIGSLSSLDDIAALWTAEYQPADALVAAKGNTLPTNNIAAAATVEDIRRAYYNDAGWDFWIEEIQLAPLQLIVVNDADGTRSRIPVVVDPDADGEAAVTFGEAVPVVVRYDDVAAPPAPENGAPDSAVAIPVVASRLRFASRAESRREVRAGTHEGDEMARSKIAAAAPGSGDANPGGLTDDQLAKVRELCGLTEDADEAVLASALEALVAKVKATEDEPEDKSDTDAGDDTKTDTDTDAGDESATGGEDPSDDPKKKKVAAGRNGMGVPETVTVDAEQFAAMQADIGRFRAFEREQANKRADEMVDAAFAAGKIGRNSVAAYKSQARKDYAGTKSILDTLAASAAFPVGEVGHSAAVDDTPDVRENAAYKNWSI